MPRYKFIREDIVREKEIKLTISRLEHQDTRIYILILWTYGLRRNEALELTRDRFQYDDEAIYIRVRSLKQRIKGPIKGSFTWLPALRDELTNLIIEYIKDIDGRLFPRNQATYWREIKAVNPYITPHVLRHSRATLLAEAGLDIYELMWYMRWNDVRTALKYLHASRKVTTKIKEILKAKAGQDIENLRKTIKLPF